MRLILDVDVLRDQLLNILLAARDTASDIHYNLPPFILVCLLHACFRRQLCYLM